MGPNTKGALLSLVAYAIYSAHDVIIKMLGGSYSAFQIVFFSVLFGFPLVMLALIRDSEPGHLRPVHPWWSLGRTLAAVVTGVCAFYAFSTLPLAQTYAILFAAPLLITLMSIPILGETVGPRRLGAVLVGLCGVLVVLRPGATDLTLGHVAAMVAAVGSSFASIVVRKIGGEERNEVLLLYPMLANFVVMLCALPWVYQPMPFTHFAGAAAISWLAFAATFTVIAAYKTGEAVIVAPMQYSQIIWATLYGALFFSEFPDVMTFVGAAIIIASGLYIVLRESLGTVSENSPVLKTRTRLDTGTGLRVGPLMDMQTDDARDND